MNIYLSSLFIYAIPANIVGAAIMYFGRKRVSWLPAEYPFIYSAWILAIVLLVPLFGGLDKAVAELDVSMSLVETLLIIGGCMGGIILLPRVIFAKAKVHALFITGVSAFLFSTAYVKLITLIFLFMPDSGQS